MNIQQWLKSRTNKVSLVIDLLATAQLALPEMRDMLGIHYGITLLIVSMLIKYLRSITKTSLEDK